MAASLPSSNLPPEPTEQLAPADLAVRLRQEQRRQWQAGQTVLVESLLSQQPALIKDVEAVLDLIYHEILLREERGEKPTLEEYQRRFPHLTEHLKDQFDVHQAVGSDSEALEEKTDIRAPGESPAETSGEPVVHRFPQDVAGFEILEELGRGGMGVVYKARQTRLKRFVALKMIRPGRGDPSELARFRGEAEAAARLQHPNIVHIHEVGLHQEQMYLVLEYISGGSLARYLAGQPQPPPEAARFVETLARAIHHAHERGIVHRDLKPANILLRRKSEIRNPKSETNPKSESAKSETEDLKVSNIRDLNLGFVSDFGFRISDFDPKITDFGLAKQMAGFREETQAEMQTETGAVLGTPSYMAPEQAEGFSQEVGPATDVYSLGAILYEMLTGRPPFKAASALETMRQVVHEEVVAPRRLQPGLPRDLETICLHCLEKKPGRRFGSALALADDLGRFVRGEPILARPVSWWERGLKWARRRPALAALAGVSVLAAVALVSLGSALWYHAEQRAAAVKTLDAARGELADLTRQAEGRRKELDQLEKIRRRTRYVVDMNKAYLAMTTNNIGLLNDLLGRYAPAAGGEDLRGFEWHYLKRMTQVAKDSFAGQTLAAVSPDDAWIATVGPPDVVKLWPRPTRKGILLKGHTAAVTGLAFWPGTGLLASASLDQTIRFWEVTSGKEQKTLPHPGPVHSLAISGDGAWLATGGQDGRVRIWRGPKLADPRVCPGHKKEVLALAFSHDGKFLASGGVDGLAKVWATESGAEVFPKLTGHASHVTGVAFSRDGSVLATSSLDHVVRLWDMTNGQKQRELRGHQGGVTALAFDPGGTHLVTASTDRTLKLWNFTTGEELRSFAGHIQEITGVAFNSTGKFFVSAGKDNAVHLWDPQGRPEGYLFTTHKGLVRGLAFSPAARRLASASNDKTIKLYDLTTGAEFKTLSGHKTFVGALAFSADGRWLASAGGVHMSHTSLGAHQEGPGEIFLWDTKTGDLLRRLASTPATIHSVAFLPGGKNLVTAGHDKTIAVWDIATGKVLWSWQAHAKPLTQVVVSPDGARLASAAWDGHVKVWQTATGKELVDLQGRAGPVYSVAFHPSGRFLASAGADRQVRIWKLDQKKPVLTLTGHERAVYHVDYSRDGQRLVTASADKTVKIWDPILGQEVLSLSHPTQVFAATLSGDGQRLAVAGGKINQGEVTVWGAGE